jgi:ethanolamine ammonia-lyase small subunit
VQIILADGLSAPGVRADRQGAARRGGGRVRGARPRVGTPVAARFARVWLQDEIGAEVGAKVAMILLGERPGLGTGDGLSAYVVYGPKIGNTDGERNMISNIHARGIPPEEAAPGWRRWRRR